MENKPTPSTRQQVRMQTVGYILTALGLVVGLAWNNAISDLIKKVVPLGKDSLTAEFIYAVILTVLVVVVSGWIQKFAAKE